MKIERRKLDELKAAEYNPRKDLRPGDAEYEKLKRSIQEFGYVEPVIWNKRTGTVVGGHQRLKVMKDLGYEEVDCVVVDLDEKKEKALNIALNKISGEWNKDLLANLLKDLDGSGYDITLTGFDLAEAQELFGSGSMENVHEDDFDAETAIEEIAEPKTKRGDLWILGQHRLLCGDCTQKEDVAKVLEDKVLDNNTGTYGYFEISALETQKVDLAAYQTKSDNSLATTAKTVVGAISEVKTTADAAKSQSNTNVTEIANIKNGATKVGSATKADNATKADTATSATSAGKWTTARTLGVSVNSGVKKDGSTAISGSGSQSVDGSADKTIAVTLGDSGVAAGTYSAVQVNAKGVAVAGGQMIEIGTSGQTTPSASLATGGLFFKVV